MPDGPPAPRLFAVVERRVRAEDVVPVADRDGRGVGPVGQSHVDRRGVPLDDGPGVNGGCGARRADGDQPGQWAGDREHLVAERDEKRLEPDFLDE